MKILRVLAPVAVFAAITVGLFVSKETVYTIASEYENKIIKRIEFVGITENESGEIEYGQLMDHSYDELLALCSSYVGEPLKSESIQVDIKALVKSANMADVKVYVSSYDDGVIVKYYCKEGPVVSQIEFRGSEKIKTDEVLQKLPFREGDPFQKSDIEEGANLILKHLVQDQGAFNATVKYLTKKGGKSGNNIVVTYFIDDGEEVKIAKINILGINKVYDHQIFGMISTKAAELLNGGEFKQEKFEEDKMKIVYFYRSMGYLDAEIIDEKTHLEWKNPETTADRELYITLKIKEGSRYYFDSYSMEGNVLIPTEKMMSQFDLKKEKESPEQLADKLKRLSGYPVDDDVVFDEIKFHHDRSIISYEYSSIGHVFARVIPEKTVIEREKKIGSVTEKRKYVSYNFKIFEGKPVDIENIIVRGNRKTKEKIIRRNIFVEEGKKYNQKMIDVSRERIYALGFFKEVNVDIRPGSDDEKVNLVFTVLEQPTGNVNIGGGVGSSTGFAISAAVGENNMRGLAQKVETKIEYGAERIASSLSYYDPYFFDTNFGFSVSLFYNLYQVDSATPYFEDLDSNSDYRQKSFGYTTGLSYKFWIYYGIGVKWKHTFKKITEASGNCSDEIFKIKSLGLQEKRTASVNLYYNSIDSALLTTKGLNVDLEASMSGGFLLGGQDHFMEYTAILDWYYSPFSLPYFPKNKCVIELRASGDFITPPMFASKVSSQQKNDRDPWLEESDRLDIGGPETVRGWDYDDDALPDSWNNGLYHRIQYGAEFRVPIIFEYIWLAFFFDAGSLWSDKKWEKYADREMLSTINSDIAAGNLYRISDIDDISVMKYFKYSWGFGTRIQIPMMPLRFWWGQKLKWDGVKNGGFTRIDDKFLFQFTIGDMRF